MRGERDRERDGRQASAPSTPAAFARSHRRTTRADLHLLARCGVASAFTLTSPSAVVGGARRAEPHSRAVALAHRFERNRRVASRRRCRQRARRWRVGRACPCGRSSSCAREPVLDFGSRHRAKSCRPVYRSRECRAWLAFTRSDCRSVRERRTVRSERICPPMRCQNFNPRRCPPSPRS